MYVISLIRHYTWLSLKWRKREIDIKKETSHFNQPSTKEWEKFDEEKTMEEGPMNSC